MEENRAMLEILKERLAWLQDEEKKTRQAIENGKIRLISLLGGQEEVRRAMVECTAQAGKEIKTESEEKEVKITG